MKIASYKAWQSKATAVDKVIAAALTARHLINAKYSHTELVFSDGMFFSISPREDVGRFKKIAQNKDHWDFIELDFSPEIEIRIREDAKQYLDDKYDWIGANTSIIPLCIGSARKIYCTEVVVNLIAPYMHVCRNIKVNGVFVRLGDGCKHNPYTIVRDLQKGLNWEK